MLPSDTLRVWKRGNEVRLDTTLLNVSEKSLKRGLRSYIIALDTDAQQVRMVTCDHESKTFARGENMRPRHYWLPLDIRWLQLTEYIL